MLGSALLVNLSYPLVLRYGVAGVAEAAGSRVGESARWNVVMSAGVDFKLKCSLML